MAALCIYLILVLLSVLAGALAGGAAWLGTAAFNVLLLYLMVRWHAGRYVYRCPRCGRQFSLTFWQDLLSPNAGWRWKYLHCPGCRRWSRMAEIPKGERQDEHL